MIRINNNGVIEEVANLEALAGIEAGSLVPAKPVPNFKDMSLTAACGIWNTDGSWELIDNDTHQPLGVRAVVESGNDLVVFFTEENRSAVTAVATVDEALVKSGWHVGSSLGLNSCTLSFSRSFSLSTVLTWSGSSSSWSSSNSAMAITGNTGSLVTLTHDSMAGSSVNVTPSAADRMPRLSSVSATTTTIAITDLAATPITPSSNERIYVTRTWSGDVNASSDLDLTPHKDGNIWLLIFGVP